VASEAPEVHSGHHLDYQLLWQLEHRDRGSDPGSRLASM
jgi:hypothetical protein